MRKLLTKKWLCFIIAAGVVCSLSVNIFAATSKHAISESDHLSYVATELIIQFNHNITFNNASGSPSLHTGIARLDSLNAVFHVTDIYRLSHQKTYTTDKKQPLLHHTYLFKFDQSDDLFNIIKAFQSVDGVQYVEPNYYYYADDRKSTTSLLSDRIQLQRAASLVHPRKPVIIGIVDTGFDWEKYGKTIKTIWHNPLEKLDGKDNDHNGFIDDVRGWNFVDAAVSVYHNNQLADQNGHGTTILMTVHKIVNNHDSHIDENQIENQLMVVKAGEQSPGGDIFFTAFSASRAIIYAADQGANIINLSWSGRHPSQLLKNAIDYAISKNCTIVAAAGNDNDSAPVYPAAFPNVLAVAGTDEWDRKSEFSNYGQWVDVAAPGSFLPEPAPSDSGKLGLSGTGIAAAYVSGIAGLLMSCEDQVNSDSLQKRIIFSSENIYHQNPDFSAKLGAGRINVLRALNQHHEPNIIIQDISFSSENRKKQLQPGDIISINVTVKNLSFKANNVLLKLTSNDPYLEILTAEHFIATLKFQEQYDTRLTPFTAAVKKNVPANYQPIITITVEADNDFSLVQNFTIRSGQMFPKNLTLVQEKPVTLSWSDSPLFSGYNIYRKINQQTSYVKLNEIPITTVKYVDEAALPGTAYFYYITGIDSMGLETLPSDTVSVLLAQNLQFRFLPDERVVTARDSIRFAVVLSRSTSDSLTYQWFVNDSLFRQSADSTFLFLTDSLLLSHDTIRVVVSASDTALSYTWKVQTIAAKTFDLDSLTFMPQADTTISCGDSLIIRILPVATGLSYLWYVNEVLDSAATGDSYLFKAPADSAGIANIATVIKAGDSSFTKMWSISFVDSLPSPEIEFYPLSDTTIFEGDSLSMGINFIAADDSLSRFRWFVNGSIDSIHQGATYVLKPDFFSAGDDTIMLFYRRGDSTRHHQWIITIKNRNRVPRLLSHTMPLDTTYTLGDSLYFSVNAYDPDGDSLTYLWFLNRQIDSSGVDTCYLYWANDSTLQNDTLKVVIADRDSSIFVQWILRTDSIRTEPMAMDSIVFYPVEDSIVYSNEDSLTFSIGLPGGDPSDFSIQWFINQAAMESASDTIFTFSPDSGAARIDTVTALVLLADTTFSHHWLIRFVPRQLLPPPVLISPLAENRMTEFDVLTWETDSTLAAIDSTGDWNYIVQLGTDSTFSGILSSDTCAVSYISLIDLIGTKHISIGQSIYWRVKLFSEEKGSSDFASSSLPFYYYPSFSIIENFYGEIDEEGINLFWNTAYEQNCAGFNLMRSKNPDGKFEKINDHLITGHKNYSWQDEIQQAGKTYYYKLEEVSVNGRRKVHQTISVEVPMPDDYSLSQNFPNPFNSQTSFKYQIPTSAHVLIEVYNILGKKVKTLVDEDKEAGFYTVYWDAIDDQGENVVSGIYFYHMSANHFQMTQKMIVVR